MQQMLRKLRYLYGERINILLISLARYKNCAFSLRSTRIFASSASNPIFRNFYYRNIALLRLDIPHNNFYETRTTKLILKFYQNFLSRDIQP